MSSPVRIGFVGAGANTRSRHLPGFKAIPGVELVAVCNRTTASAKKVAHEFGIRRVVETWREVVEADDIDAVCIGTWPNLHARLSVAALRAGKHVLTEARMARNLAEAEAMLAEARSRPDLVAQIVPAPMTLPFDATVQRLLHEGELGEIREICLTCTNGSFADRNGPLTWRQDMALSGKNTLFMGIYYEMALRWLQLEPVSVVAEAAAFTRERVDAEGTRHEVMIPESVTVLATYVPPPGWSQGSGPRLVGHFSGVESGLARNEIRLNGSKACMRLDLAAGELWLTKIGGKEAKVEIPAKERGEWRVEADFVDSIREKKPVRLTDFATGVKYMRFTEAVWESWSNGGARVTLL